MKSLSSTLILLTACILSLDASAQGRWAMDSTTNFSPVGFAASTVLNGKICVVGGYEAFGSGAFANQFQMFDPFTHYWSTYHPVGSGEVSLSCNAFDGKIYVFGGATWDSLASASVEVFDSTSKTWGDGPTMPTPRSGHGSCVLNGKIYLFGGYGNNSGELVGNIDVFDPSTNTWITPAPSMPEGRVFFASCVNGEKIYVMGGIGGAGQRLSSVEIFDPSTNTWNTGRSMPGPMAKCGCSSLNGMIYVMGGEDGGNNNSLYIFDTVTNSWTTGPSMPIGSIGLTSDAVDGALYAIGGFDRDAGNDSSAIEANQVFTPGTMDVTDIPSFVNSATILRVFPNPSKNELQIMSGPIGTARLFNLLGSEVLEAKVDGPGATLDVSKLERGTYFLRVANQSAKVTIGQ